MTKADFLMASLRQLTTGIVPSRGGAHSTHTAKDGKDKAAQFHEQLRLVSRGVKHAAQPKVDAAEPDPLQTAETEARVAEAVAQPDSVRTKDKARHPNAGERHESHAKDAPASQDWHAPETALSAVMSKLDQPPKAAAFDDKDKGTARATQPERRGDPLAAPLKPDAPARTTATDEMPGQNVQLSLAAANTRGASPVKVVVRQQETHFQPVPQLTQLQKIVDHVAADMPAATAQPDAAAVNAATQDAPRAADKPVKILTVQLDPPSLGTVTVRVRLTGDAVDVQVSADRYDTAQMLRHERDALTERMHSAGYKFEISSIDHNRVGDIAASGQTPSRSDHQQSSSQQQQPQGGLQFNGGNSERQQPGDAQAGARQNRQGHDQFAERPTQRREQDAAQDRSGGAVYL
jgi:chemotaxis protein MotD